MAAVVHWADVRQGRCVVAGGAALRGGVGGVDFRRVHAAQRGEKFQAFARVRCGVGGGICHGAGVGTGLAASGEPEVCGRQDRGEG